MKDSKYGIKVYAAAVTVLLVLSVAAFMFVFFRAGYHSKMLVKLGLKEQTSGVNYAVLAWENCLKKMDCNADVVFFGDSITQGSDFAAAFPDAKIVNLGYGGDTLSGMINRVTMVQALAPKQVFLLGGINGLTDMNLSQSVRKYRTLISGLQEALPDAEIYIQSVLPVSKKKELSVCHNTTIEAFNEELEKIAEEFNMVYVDLYNVYLYDGELNPEMTNDGIHLKKEAYAHWANAIKKYID